MSPSFVKVTNLERYQHYRDRRPVWVKLYQSVLDDYAFTELSDACKFHFVGIILLASRLGNRVPADAEWISRQLSATELVDLGQLRASGLIQDCADCASPERERESERER